MKKVFNRDGEYVVRFAADAKEQIQEWLGEWLKQKNFYFILADLQITQMLK